MRSLSLSPWDCLEGCQPPIAILNAMAAESSPSFLWLRRIGQDINSSDEDKFEDIIYREGAQLTTRSLVCCTALQYLAMSG